jgi:hypothetical protein
MPEFIIERSTGYGYTEFRTAENERHARRILAGFKGRYPGSTLKVHRIGATWDVSADFINGE